MRGLKGGREDCTKHEGHGGMEYEARLSLEQ